MLFSKLFFCLAALLVLGTVPAHAAEEKNMSGHDLAVMMDAVDNSTDSYSLGHMTIVRGSKTLKRTFETYTKVMKPNKEEERNLFVFNEPAEVKGTIYLEWTYAGLDKEDDLWVFLPSENLVRRISGSSMYSSFMRSDLANEDLQNLDDVEEYDYTLLGSETVDGTDCYILERRAKAGKDTQYSRHKQWVRKDNLLRRKMEFYDKKDKLLKTMYFDECAKIDGIWTTTKARIVRADGKSVTYIDWSDIKYNLGLKDERFDHSQLHR